MKAIGLLVQLVFICSTYGYDASREYTSYNDPPGHLQPIGWHVHPIRVETRMHIPSPEEFYTRYAARGVPVVFKGAASRFPAYMRWTDEYLRKYGNWKVIVEDGKKEDMSRPTYQMSLHKWLDGYKGNDTYLVQDLVPPNPMTREIPVPRCIQCGGFQNRIQTTILWFSSGGTKSRFHADSIDNFECMFSGWKETLLIDKVAGQTLFLGNEAAYTHLDVDRVDMYKYPALQNVTWHKMHVEPGDCYFVPYKWYQFENSSNTRNLAVSFWLTHQFRYEDDCQYPEKRKSWLSDVKMSSGDEQSRVEVLELFFGNETMTLDTFRHFFVENKTDSEESTTQEVSTKSRSRITKNWINDHKSNVIDKMFQKIDTNGDKLLSIEEVYNAELVYFTRLIGSLGEHYMEYETLQDGGGYETGKDILAQKKLKYMRNEL